MNYKYIPFNKQVDINVGNSLDKAAVVTSAVALGVSNGLFLPTSMVENPLSYFNLMVLPTITKIISEWNENIILDINACVEQTRMFWLIRYTAAYPLSHPRYSAGHDFFDTVHGICGLVPQELHEFLDGPNRAAILALSLHVIDINESNAN